MKNRSEKKRLDGNSFLLAVTIILFFVMYIAGIIMFGGRGFAKVQNFLNLFISNAGLIVVATGMTIVMITHFMEEAAQAQRVVVMDAGQIRLDGTPDEILTQAAVLEHLNLEVPFAARLSLLLQRRGISVKTHVAVDELKEELCQLRSRA